MARFDYDVLTWQVDAQFDWEELRDAYISGRHDGIYLRASGRRRLANLDFLENLPSLRYLEVLGAISDDSYAFTIEGLCELVLLTKCQVAIPGNPGRTLESVGVDCRPGVSHLSRLSALRQLQLWNFNASSFADMPVSSTLTRLKVEGRRQDVSLQGLESCKALTDVEILEMQIESLGPLRELSRLRRLWLIGFGSALPGHSLTLEDLSRDGDLEELRITNQGSIASAEPLLNFPHLRDVRLRGTRIADGNLDPLEVLAGRAVVVGPAD